MSESLLLLVNGKRYGGWKSVRVTRSIESLAGSFELEASEDLSRGAVLVPWFWGGGGPWMVVEEDACRVELGGTVVLDGFIDRRSISLSSSSKTFTYSGRDRAAALVDTSALPKRWSIDQSTVLDLARTLAEPFGIRVSLQPGIELPKAKQVISPGETAYDALARAANAAGVLLVSNGGDILITRTGTARAAVGLVEGENVLAASVEYNTTERFHRYVVATQRRGTDTASGAAVNTWAEARDLGMRRTGRTLLIRPDKGMAADSAQRRADWEARIRAARAESVSIVVQGWFQEGTGADWSLVEPGRRSGVLWPLNALVSVEIPSIGLHDDLLIAELEHSLSESGETTQLRLVRPDAFTPEPKAVVKRRVGRKPRGSIRELDQGVPGGGP